MWICYSLDSQSQFIRPHSNIICIASHLSFTIAIITTPFILIISYSIHCLVSINSTHSDSSQWSLFYRIHPISTLVSLLFTIQWSILMYNPTPKSIIQLLSETILFHSVFSISVLLWVSNPKGHLKQTLCWNAHISVITSYMNVSLCCSYKEGCLLSYKIIN